MINDPSQLSGLRSTFEILHLPTAFLRPLPPDIGTKKPRWERGLGAKGESGTVVEINRRKDRLIHDN